MIESDNKKIIEEKLSGYSDIIKSKNIISFWYKTYAFQVDCMKIDNHKTRISACGGLNEERNGTAFRLKYDIDNIELLRQLQKIIEKYKISYNNGYVLQTLEIPIDYGDSLSVIYDSNERIYKASNKMNVISREAIKEIYDLFHYNSIDNGLDFTMEKSNQNIYNDATEEYLQGRWRGKHLDKEYIVDFMGNAIKIFCDNRITDDTNYLIIRGSVRQDKKKENVGIATSENDFEEFNGVSCFKRKDDYTLIAYFMNNDYSTELFTREIID